MTSNLPTLPANWELKKLGDVVTEISSKVQAQQCQDLPYISLENIESQTGKLLNVSTAKESNVIGTCSKFTKDTVIYSKLRPYLNKVAIPDFAGVGTTELIVFHPKDNLDKIFLANFLRSESVVSIINASSYGAKMPRTSSKFLKELEIPLPPLDEQKRLVSLLDTLFAKIDRSIELLEENITAADALLPSALNTVFAVEIVQEWEKYQFDKISKFIDYRGKTPTKTENGTILITAKNVRFGYLSDEPKEYIADADYEGWMTRGIPNQGDVIFTTEAPLGNVAILNTNEKRAFAQRVVTFQSINDVYDSNFLYWYMLSPIFQKELYDSATGTTVKGIKTSILKKFKIPLPPLDIQAETVAYLDSIRTKVEILKQVQNDKIANLKALKASILDRAFKGEL